MLDSYWISDTGMCIISLCALSRSVPQTPSLRAPLPQTLPGVFPLYDSPGYALGAIVMAFINPYSYTYALHSVFGGGSLA